MKFLWSSFLVLCCTWLPAQTFYKLDSTFHDGPYVFFENDQVVARWVFKGQMEDDTLVSGERLHLDPRVSESFDPVYLTPEKAFSPSPASHFQGVEKLVAISDIHGQYDLFVRLLYTHGVINESGDWAFGKGHLVVVGDIFDRGGEVTDLLWMVHKLEQQAGMAGGMVHYLIGNHEIMNLHNDLRYVNKKYRYTTTMLKTPYPLLFGPDTYLGRWLRSKPIVISINDMVFVHAGLSEACLNLGLTFEEINAAFRDSIFDKTEEKINANPALRLLYGELGPLWYRGYWGQDFTKKRAHNILKRLEKKHIIVGHTPFPSIVSEFRSKIIGVDSTIQMGEKGEVLLYEEGKLFRGTLEGDRIPIKKH